MVNDHENVRPRIKENYVVHLEGVSPCDPRPETYVLLTQRWFTP